MAVCEGLINLLSAALTPVIGITAAYIAYQQYRLNRSKLRLDMYDRRSRVYGALIDMVSGVLPTADVPRDDFHKFNLAKAEAVFLFENDVAKYLEELRKKAVRLMYLRSRINSEGLPVGDERTRVVGEHIALLQWFADQTDSAQKLFAKYLAFTK